MAAGCLLYTDPINAPPSVSISRAEGKIVLREAVDLVAMASDPDQPASTLAFAWRQAPTCPAPGGEQEGAPSGTEPRYPFVATTLEEVCVWVVVTDKHGATGADTVRITPTNQAPRAAMELVAVTRTARAATSAGDLFELNTAFRASARQSADPDGHALTYAWALTDPAGAATVPRPCAADPAEVCFTLGTPGPHQLDLVVKDALGAEGSAEPRRLMVQEDRPPCIVDVRPAVPRVVWVDEPDDSRFEVLSVDDDLDPFPLDGAPAPQTGFRWKYRIGTSGAFERPTYSLPVYAFPKGTFRPGTIVQVRVEYHDRVTRDLAGCDREAERCELAPRCAQWVTWTVEYR